MADIYDTAVANGSFTTLITAVQNAGWVETLKSEGPFTLFAPTDDAFAKLPADTVQTILNDYNKLVAVVSYHAVNGSKLTASDISGMVSIPTILGQNLPVDTSAGVKVGGATVTQPDIECDNGIIHVIDTVLMPE